MVGGGGGEGYDNVGVVDCGPVQRPLVTGCVFHQVYKISLPLSSSRRRGVWEWETRLEWEISTGVGSNYRREKLVDLFINPNDFLSTLLLEELKDKKILMN